MLPIKPHYEENVDASGVQAIQKDFQNNHFTELKIICFVFFFSEKSSCRCQKCQ